MHDLVVCNNFTTYLFKYTSMCTDKVPRRMTKCFAVFYGSTVVISIYLQFTFLFQTNEIKLNFHIFYPSKLKMPIVWM